MAVSFSRTWQARKKALALGVLPRYLHVGNNNNMITSTEWTSDDSKSSNFFDVHVSLILQSSAESRLSSLLRSSGLPSDE